MPFSPVIVVVGHDEPLIRPLAAGQPIKHHPDLGHPVTRLVNKPGVYCGVSGSQGSTQRLRQRTMKTKKGLHKNTVVLMAGIVLGAGLLQGCRDADHFRKLRIENADRHFAEIAKRVLPAGKVFPLPECIAAALENNLDIKAQELREAVTKERATAAVLGMLPGLNVDYSGTDRSNEPGASSESIRTGLQSLVASKSTEKEVHRVKIELVLGVLDFGLAYFDSIQADDRVVLTSQQKRRAAQNLTMDVVKAYLRIAATQYAMTTTENMISRGEDTEKVLQEIRRAGNLSPLEVLEQKKTFLRLKQRLREYKRSYDNSCIELTSLMGYYPSNRIKVDVTCLDSLTEPDLPGIDVLERLALEERPELAQLDVQSDMVAMEAKKAILMMFPNVRLFGSYTASTNKYLYNQNWLEVGVSSAYDLLRLPTHVTRWRAFDKEIDEIDMRTRALSVGIMAQVRIAHANVLEVKDRYGLSEQILAAYREHLEQARKTVDADGGLTPIEVRRYELETAAAAIDRTLELGNYYLAFYRLLNTLGVESLDQEKLGLLRARLEAQEEQRAAENDEDENAETIVQDAVFTDGPSGTQGIFRAPGPRRDN